MVSLRKGATFSTFRRHSKSSSRLCKPKQVSRMLISNFTRFSRAMPLHLKRISSLKFNSSWPSPIFRMSLKLKTIHFSLTCKIMTKRWICQISWCIIKAKRCQTSLLEMRRASNKWPSTLFRMRSKTQGTEGQWKSFSPSTSYKTRLSL